MTKKTMAALALALLFTTATQASELSYFEKIELRIACGPDLEAACADIEAGDGLLARCITDNMEKLSQPCRDAITRIRADFLTATDAAMDF